MAKLRGTGRGLEGSGRLRGSRSRAATSAPRENGLISNCMWNFRSQIRPATCTARRRGNSGILINNMYEVQVLDSYQDKTYRRRPGRRDLRADAAVGQRLPSRRANGKLTTSSLNRRAGTRTNELVQKACITVLSQRGGGPAQDRVDRQHRRHRRRRALPGSYKVQAACPPRSSWNCRTTAATRCVSATSGSATSTWPSGSSCSGPAFQISWVARATRPSRRATGPAAASDCDSWQRRCVTTGFLHSRLRSASRRPAQAGRLCHPITAGRRFPCRSFREAERGIGNGAQFAVNGAEFFAVGTGLARRPFLNAQQSEQPANAEQKNEERPAGDRHWRRIVAAHQRPTEPRS